jgi:hypothetical protein
LSAIGHERENKSFEAVNAVLHVIGGGRRAGARGALLAVARSSIRT